MAIAGSWLAGAVTPAEYSGATRQGTGINPIHGVHDNTGRPSASRIPIGATDDDAYVPENILGASQWGYSSEDAAAYPGEDYRYVTDDYAQWGDEHSASPNRDGRIMTEGEWPQPEGWPQWGPHGADNPDFPAAGWPGGADVRAYSDGAEVENARMIAVPTPGVSGGWLNKLHGNVLAARDADPSQVMVNTSGRQLSSHLDNNRAVTRGTDALREAIANRLTGMKAREYARSEGMGGGPGTPDMAPVTQALPYRPWFFRSAAAPPMEDHQYNSVTYFEPVLRTLPPDAGELVTTPEAAAADDGDYGYAGSDYYA